MRTQHERRLRRAVESHFMRGTTNAQLAVMRRAEFEAHHRERTWMADFVFQNRWEKRAPGLDELFVYSEIVNAIGLGRFAKLAAEVCFGPLADKETEGNQRLLDEGLPDPFRAKFWGGAGEQDGYLETIEPTTGYIVARDPDGPIDQQIVIPPFLVPLEVGQTSASRTYAHVFGECGIARWPYGSEWVNILVRVKPPEDERGGAR